MKAGGITVALLGKIGKFNPGAFIACLALAGLLLPSACVYDEPGRGTASDNESNANAPKTRPDSPDSNSNAESVSKSAGPDLDRWAVTLPVLAVFLMNPDVVKSLKSEVGLTNEQVERLKDASQAAASDFFRRSEQPDVSGVSEQAMRQSADSEIRQIIGDEKTPRLYDLILNRWSGGEDSGRPLAPGVVPQDTRIVINIPAFRMDLFEQGRLLKSFEIGIGYPEFPLPTGLRHAKMIIFNPPWTPPDSSWVEDMGGRIKSGETIKPGDKSNPLGILKVPIGLPSLIHGGKPLWKIGTYASHGCVGLTNIQAREFAKFLAGMGGIELTDSEISRYRRDRFKSTTLDLKTAVPVELRYNTVVVEGGSLHIYPDVYYLGTNTEQNLTAALSEYGVGIDQLNPDEKAAALNALQQMNRELLGVSAGGHSKGSKKEATPPASVAAARKRLAKSRKEIVVDSKALEGRGYPVAVDLSTGRNARVR
jgi:hypothetical protein